jgi:hypothetical protein
MLHDKSARRVRALTEVLELNEAIAIEPLAPTRFRVDGVEYLVLDLEERNAVWRATVGHAYDTTSPEWLPADLSREQYVREVMEGEEPSATLGELMGVVAGFEVFEDERSKEFIAATGRA